MTTRLLTWSTLACGLACAPSTGSVPLSRASTSPGRPAVARGLPSTHDTSLEQAPKESFTRGWIPLGSGEGTGHGLATTDQTIVVDSAAGRAVYCERRSAAGHRFTVAALMGNDDGARSVYLITHQTDGTWTFSLRSENGETMVNDAALCAACHQRRDEEPLFRPDFIECNG